MIRSCWGLYNKFVGRHHHQVPVVWDFVTPMCSRCNAENQLLAWSHYHWVYLVSSRQSCVTRYWDECKEKKSLLQPECASWSLACMYSYHHICVLQWSQVNKQQHWWDQTIYAKPTWEGTLPTWPNQLSKHCNCYKLHNPLTRMGVWCIE